MKLTIAGEVKEYPDGTTVKQVIDNEDVDEPLYVTVSVNDEFVRSEDFETRELADGDEVEFLYFMGGGAR